LLKEKIWQPCGQCTNPPGASMPFSRLWWPWRFEFCPTKHFVRRQFVLPVFSKPLERLHKELVFC
jgi:hypothetical protein